MSVEPIRQLSPDQYLAFERSSEVRHEFLDGEVVAMGGASPRHNLVVTNLVRELSSQLKDRPCRVFASDLRVRGERDAFFTYPDLVVVCGEPRFADDQRDTLVNPTLVVEVLSQSTEAYDRGEKFARYRRIPSLVEYLLVAQIRPRIESFRRGDDGLWRLAETSALDETLELASIGCRLALAEIYDKTDLG